MAKSIVMLKYEPTQSEDHAIPTVYVINNVSLIGFRIQHSLNLFQNAYTESWKALPDMHVGTMLNNFLSANRAKPFILKTPNSLGRTMTMCAKHRLVTEQNMLPFINIHCYLDMTHCNLPFLVSDQQLANSWMTS